jgi:AraC family transcriptional regulator, transcriptional activator of pobA
MIQFYTTNDAAIDLKKPSRVLKYKLIYCNFGTVSLTIDENEFILEPNQVITITSGQIHFFKDFKNAELFILEFTFDFFCKNDHDIELIFHNGLFCHFGMNEVITISKADFFKELLQKIGLELSQKPYQYLISVHSNIELLLVEINRSKMANGDEIWKPDALFLHFLESVRKHFKNNFTVSKHADLVHSTEAKLNELSKLHTGKTAQNVIYGLIVSEAKRRLLYEDISIKEIAFELGFNDPFYFSNFFKKHTNLSPKNYKKEVTV